MQKVSDVKRFLCTRCLVLKVPGVKRFWCKSFFGVKVVWCKMQKVFGVKVASCERCLV